MLKKHEEQDLMAASNVIIQAMNTENWRECHHMLQLVASTIDRIAIEFEMRMLNDAFVNGEMR